MGRDLSIYLKAGLLFVGLVVASLPVRAMGALAPFPLATVEVETQIESPAHRVLLSPVREVNDEIRSETVVRVPVRGTGALLRIAEDSSRVEARAYYRQQLQQLGARVLYECEGRNCGRSNVWANQIFGQATLYGRDAEQDYLAAVVDQDERRLLVLVYTVTRGNLREYVWVEQLVLGEGASLPAVSNGGGRIRGPIVVPWSGGVTVRFDWSSTDRRHLNNWAAEEGATVLLTSRTALRSDETLQQSLERSGQALTSMASLLAKSGIREDRQTQINIGPAVQSLDPAGNTDRIEILVILAP